MSKAKYDTIGYMQEVDALGASLSNAMFDVLRSLKGKISEDEWNFIREKQARINGIIGYEMVWSFVKQFPELCLVEFLGKIEKEVLYDIKSQRNEESPEEYVVRGLSAEVVTDELAKHKEKSDGKKLIWAELDERSVNLLKEYHRQKKITWQEKMAHKKTDEEYCKLHEK
jgi:hypothetical protein